MTESVLKGPGFWEKELARFCSVFGFEVRCEYVARCLDSAGFSVSDSAGTRYRVMAGRCCVSYVDKSASWRSGTTQFQVDVPYSDDLSLGERRDRHFKALFAMFSGKELVVRSSDNKRESKYGFTKVRLERHIILPEFSSVDELLLKLEVTG